MGKEIGVSFVSAQNPLAGAALASQVGVDITQDLAGKFSGSKRNIIDYVNTNASILRQTGLFDRANTLIHSSHKGVVNERDRKSVV